MASFNKALLVGNLTKDPELRYTPQGTAVVNLRLAVNRRFKNKNQELKEEVCFITAVVWNKQAETCNQYLHKGSSVLVEGRLQSRSWEDASGQKKSVIEIRAERVQFLGKSSPKTSDTNAETIDNTGDHSSETVWIDEESEGDLNDS